MKRLARWIKRQWIWFTSKEVRNAIDSGATYEEVQNIVTEGCNNA
jgi:hypothetical protein